MLIEPGSRDRARIDRLALVTACPAEMPVSVDGGITEDIAPLCVTAGAQSGVVGRALLVDLPPGAPLFRETSNVGTHQASPDGRPIRNRPGQLDRYTHPYNRSGTMT